MQRSFAVATGLCLLALALLGACTVTPKAAADPDLAVDPRDSTARRFDGTIISFRPMTSTMLIATGTEVPPNQVQCKYDANTRFFLDGQPTTLDEIRQYMPVKVKGYVGPTYFHMEIAKFSSQLPANVKPAPATMPAK